LERATGTHVGTKTAAASRSSFRRVQAAASFLRKEGGLSGRLKIWQSALQ
jgi:hypothetical protein